MKQDQSGITHLLLPLILVILVATASLFAYTRINSADNTDSSSESSSSESSLSYALETRDFSLSLPAKARNDDFHISKDDILTTIDRPYGKLEIQVIKKYGPILLEKHARQTNITIDGNEVEQFDLDSRSPDVISNGLYTRYLFFSVPTGHKPNSSSDIEIKQKVEVEFTLQSNDGSKTPTDEQLAQFEKDFVAIISTIKAPLTAEKQKYKDARSE